MAQSENCRKHENPAGDSGELEALIPAEKKVVPVARVARFDMKNQTPNTPH